MTATALTGTAWPRVLRAVAMLTGVLAVLLIAFALPAQHLAPRQLPLAVAGPEGAKLADRIETARPGAFRLDRVADEATARERILQREDYGAIVVESTGPRVLTAAAAGPAVAQVLNALAAGLPAPVTDIVPLPADDPMGAGLTGGALPLVLGGWICALVLLRVVHGTRERLAGAFGFAAVGALTFIAIEKYGFGSVTGNYLLISAGVALGVAATAWTILGLQSALGGRGLALGAVIVMLLGYPLCGLMSAPELLPAPFGAIGQFLPPGAACTLLRSTAFFDGNGGLRPALVLACWLAAGLGLYLLGERRAPRTAAEAAPAPAAPEPIAV